jgi:GNAT superfamily N-acetyltransferase
MLIRRLVPSDAAAYRALMLEAYGRSTRAFTSTVAERIDLPLSWWEGRLVEDAEPSELILGAFEEERLSGSAGIAFESREKIRHKSTLFGVYVPPEFRGRGIGRGLVEEALSTAGRRPGVRVLQLTVTEGNREAHSLYEQCGFVQFGEEPLAVAIGSEFLSKIHMWREVGTSGPVA